MIYRAGRLNESAADEIGNIAESPLGGTRNTYVATVKSYPGETLSEQIRNCLVDLGVDESDIDVFA